MVKNRMSTIAKAQKVSLPSITSTSGGSGIYSFGIVNSKNNGKRLSFSKALAEKLELDAEAYITPIVEDGEILVMASKMFDSSFECGLRGEDKKLSYRAGVVEALVELFRLDFGKHVSMSFSKIDFFQHEGVTVAAIQLADPIAAEDVESEGDDVA